MIIIPKIDSGVHCLRHIRLFQKERQLQFNEAGPLLGTSFRLGMCFAEFKVEKDGEENERDDSPIGERERQRTLNRIPMCIDHEDVDPNTHALLDEMVLDGTAPNKRLAFTHGGFTVECLAKKAFPSIMPGDYQFAKWQAHEVTMRNWLEKSQYAANSEWTTPDVRLVIGVLQNTPDAVDVRVAGQMQKLRPLNVPMYFGNRQALDPGFPSGDLEWGDIAHRTFATWLDALGVGKLPLHAALVCSRSRSGPGISRSLVEFSEKKWYTMRAEIPHDNWWKLTEPDWEKVVPFIHQEVPPAEDAW